VPPFLPAAAYLVVTAASFVPRVPPAREPEAVPVPSPLQRVDRGMAVVFPGAPFVLPPPLLVRTPAWSPLGASVVVAPMVFPNGLHLFSFPEPQSYPRRCTLCQEGAWGVGAGGSS